MEKASESQMSQVRIIDGKGIRNSDVTGKNNCIFDLLFKHIHCEIM
jgi:hypothetical protein